MYGVPRPFGSLRPLGTGGGPPATTFGETRVVAPRACRRVVIEFVADSPRVDPRACRLGPAS